MELLKVAYNLNVKKLHKVKDSALNIYQWAYIITRMNCHAIIKMGDTY